MKVDGSDEASTVDINPAITRRTVQFGVLLGMAFGIAIGIPLGGLVEHSATATDHKATRLNESKAVTNGVDKEMRKLPQILPP